MTSMINRIPNLEVRIEEVESITMVGGGGHNYSIMLKSAHTFIISFIREEMIKELKKPGAKVLVISKEGSSLFYSVHIPKYSVNVFGEY